MALDKFFGLTQAVQDASPQQYYRAYEAIMRRTYPGVESMVGAQFWGTNELATTGLHNEVLFHTGLLGTAVKLGPDLRNEVPSATFETAEQIVADYQLLGIGFEYAPEEMQDMLYQDIILSKVGDLPDMLADAEEDEHFAPFINGEVGTGGWTGSPLFVNGTSQFLQTMGYKGVNRGSNIITNGGGVSYHLISLLEQYGTNFVNEEGRISPLKIDRILGSPQNAQLLRMYYGATTNIEQMNPAMPNPTRYTPEIFETHRLDNPNDIYVFYEGWQEDLKERSKWRGQTMTDEVGWLNQKMTKTIIRSYYAYYWFSNRRVVKVKGIA